MCQCAAIYYCLIFPGRIQGIIANGIITIGSSGVEGGIFRAIQQRIKGIHHSNIYCTGSSVATQVGGGPGNGMVADSKPGSVKGRTIVAVV